MSQGLPVVVADDLLGGNRGVVDDRQDGHVVKFSDSEAFARVLSQLLQDAGLRQEMGKRARRKIEEKFSIESVANQYCALYHELLGAQAK
jgi:glycosyltransferase involved in cell wall biosynthesis